MTQVTIAEVMVRQLELADVKRIYGLIGDSLNVFGQAVKNSKLQWVAVRHEETAAYAAAGEAEYNGKLAVCAGTCGPGSIHLINGLYEANRNNVPVLAVVSHIPSSELGFDYFQATHPERVFTDCSVFCETLVNPAQMPRLLFSAIQTAISKQGVSVLIVPGDIMAQTLPQMPKLRAPIYSKPRLLPAEAEITELSRLLNSQQKIALYCGYGCKNCVPEVIHLAEKLQAPSMSTIRSRCFMVPDNPYAVGLNGYLANGSAQTALNECDCLVLLGMDLPFSGLLAKVPFVIQIDAEGAHIGRRARVDFGVVGSIKETLQAVLPQIKNKTDDTFLQKALATAKDVEAKQKSQLAAMANSAVLEPEYLTTQLSKIARKDAIFVVDVGLSDKWAARYIEPQQGRIITGSFKHGTMAAALGEAIGLAFAAPERQIIVLAGDGGLTMLLGDLLTVVQYHLPLNIVVYNNQELGYINFEAEESGFAPFATQLQNPDFAALGQVIGLNGQKIDAPAETAVVLQQALAQNSASLIEARTNPLALGKI